MLLKKTYSTYDEIQYLKVWDPEPGVRAANGHSYLPSPATFIYEN